MNYLVTDEQLIATADAIREKTGGTDLLTWDESRGFSDAVSGIEAGGGGDIENPYVEYVSWNDSNGWPKEAKVRGLQCIHKYMFYKNTSLVNVVFDGVVREIDISAFEGCSSLALTSLPSGLTEISSNVFKGCSKLALTSLPSGLTVIDNSAFYNCSNLVLTSLPSGLDDIYGYAFYGCSNLALTSLPSGLITIYSYTFYNCKRLTELDMPNVAQIDANALSGCVALNKLILRKSDGICTLSDSSAFKNTPFASGGTGGTVYVPSALITEYQNATNWSTLYAAGTCNFVAIEGSEYE